MIRPDSGRDYLTVTIRSVFPHYSTNKSTMVQQHRGSPRLQVLRLWAVSGIQESVEMISRAWLAEKFISPFMCRVSVQDSLWCMVPSLTEASMHRVPAEECSFNPWCGALIHQDTAPPLLTRLTVLWVALLVSLVFIWAPRILTYRPKNPALIWLRRQTPRHVLLLAAGGAVLQLALEHLILPAFLPPTRLLTHTVSLFAFCFANLITSVVLIARPKGREAYKTHSLGERTPASIGSTTDPQGVLRDIGDDKLP